MGGGRSKRRKTHLFDDQYGTTATTDSSAVDRDASRVSRGTGGSVRRGGSCLEYVKQVPKFLQDHAHLLGHGPTTQNATYSSLHSTTSTSQQQQQQQQQETDDEEEEEKEAGLLQALEQDGDLVKEYPELAILQKKKDAEMLKDEGNKAFVGKLYTDAVDIFTRCIELDGENPVYFSNRAAALIELGEYEEAVENGRECVRLNPQWAKGYVRLGIALLRQGSVESAHVLKKAKALEPDMQGLDDLLCKAIQLVQEQRRCKVAVVEKPSCLLSFHHDDDDDDE